MKPWAYRLANWLVKGELDRSKRYEEYLLSVIKAMNTESPSGAHAFYKLASYKEPLYVEAWKRMESTVASAVDDLVDVIDWLRESKHYPEGDRVRTIVGRLARARTEQYREEDLFNGEPLYRTMARDWPVQLTVKESKQLIKERDEAIAKLKDMEANETLD